MVLTINFFHSSGIQALVNALRLAATGMLLVFFPAMWMENAGPARAFKALSHFQPRALVAGSHLIMTLTHASKEASANLELSSLVVLAPIGSAIPSDSQVRLKGHFPQLMAILNRYGLTEVISNSTQLYRELLIYIGCSSIDNFSNPSKYGSCCTWNRNDDCS